jgi:hypothetical protein
VRYGNDGGLEFKLVAKAGGFSIAAAKPENELRDADLPAEPPSTLTPTIHSYAAGACKLHYWQNQRSSILHDPTGPHTAPGKGAKGGSS